MAKKLSMLVILTTLLVMTLVASFIMPATAQMAMDAPTGDLRLVNGLVGLGPVDVYLNDRRLAYDLAPEAATTYFTILAGRYTVTVRPAGAEPYSVPIADILVDLVQGQSLTAIAYQKQFAAESYVPPYEQAGAIYVVADDRSPIQPGKTRLTAVHLAVGAPDSITVAYPRASLLYNVGLEKPFGSVDSDSGLYSLTLVDAQSASQNVLERFGDQSFYANTLYTLVIVPNMTYTLSTLDQRPLVAENNPQPRLFIVAAPVQPPEGGMRLRLINSAYSIPSLDLYIDGQLTAERMNYSSISEYLGLPGYRHSITLRRAGAAADSQPLAEATLSIPADNQPQRDWTLLLVNGSVPNEAALQQVQAADQTLPSVTNTPNSAVMMTLLPDNLSQTAAQQSRLRLLHAVDSLPPISLFSPDTVLYDSLPGVVATPTLTPIPAAFSAPLVSLVNQALFGATAGETEVRTGIYNELNLQLLGNGNEIQTLPSVHFVPELVYTYVVMGSPSGNPPIQVMPITDFGQGEPFFRPGQLPTPTMAPTIIVTRVPRTPTPGTADATNGLTATAAPQTGGGGQPPPGSGGGSGGGLQPPAPTLVPPTPVPPTRTSVPPTPIPPTPVPPTPVPPTPEPPTPIPPTPIPPTPVPPTPEPPTPGLPPSDGGLIPPILKTLLPPLGDLPPGGG